MFGAELVAIDDKKLMVSAKKEDVKIASKAQADELCSDIEKVTFKVTEIKKRQRHRKAPAPFTTSSLQQDAARKLGFTSRKTMMIAQQLYEGISLGKKGPTGLITYMRTDSTRISEEADASCREYIAQQYGEQFVGDKTAVKSSKTGKIQDAHEAIRPTDSSLSPAMLKEQLPRDLFRLKQYMRQHLLKLELEITVLMLQHLKSSLMDL